MKFYLLLIVSLFIFSCKGDNTESNLSGEEEYFEDYQEPFYKWGFIDTEGKMVIEKKFDDLRPFQNGLARANYNGKWGFIDKTGNDVIHFKYRGTFPFKDGLARVQNFEKKYGFIDNSGEMIIPDTMSLVFDFNSERARAKKGTAYGYINTKGEWVIPPTFKKCSNFENDHARVYQFGKVAVIDSDGNFKIPYEDGNEKMFTTSNDLVRAKKGKSYRYYSLKNYKVKKDGFINATDFVDNLCAVETSKKEWKVMNTSFKELFTIQGDKVKYAGNKMWIVVNDGIYKLVNSSGKSISEKPYSMLYGFNEGLAPFEEDGKWGYLDINGQEVMEANLPLAWEFEEGYARMITNKGIMYINPEMELIFPDGYSDAHNFSEGLAHVQ